MPIFRGSIYSKTLNMYTRLSVAFPKEMKKEGSYKVIYLLHGLSDNADNWADNTMVSIYSKDYEVIFIMPEVQRSFYTDMVYGLDYYTYITKELPDISKRMFPISDRAEDTAIIGLSMGGYGALKCAFRNPEKYSLCAAFSSAVSIQELLNMPSDFPEKEKYAICGNNMSVKKEDDLEYLAKECNKKIIKPNIYMTCGTEDELRDMNVKFKEYMEKLDFHFQYWEWEGIHDWYFWNASLELIMETCYK